VKKNETVTETLQLLREVYGEDRLTYRTLTKILQEMLWDLQCSWGTAPSFQWILFWS